LHDPCSQIRSVVRPLVEDVQSIYRRNGLFHRAAVTQRLIEGGGGMADAGLYISWGETYPGREEQGMRLWNDANSYYTSLLEAGRISRYERFVLGANGGVGVRGFTIIGGTPEQIGALTVDDEWVSYIMRAQLCCKDVDVTSLFFGESLAHIMELWEHEISALA
jgi:hypothetical protein